MLKESSAQYERLKGSEWEKCRPAEYGLFTVGASLQNAQTDVQTPVSDMVSPGTENIMNAGGITQSPLIRYNDRLLSVYATGGIMRGMSSWNNISGQ